MTLADLVALIAAVALALTIPARAMAWPPFFPAPAILIALIGSLRLIERSGLVLALVLIFRRGRYAGPVRPAEWFALGLGSHGLLEAVPNIDDAVNSYYRAVGSASLDFGLARWLMAAPATLGLILTIALLVLLRRQVRDGRRVASALSVVGSVAALFFWFWGPCEIARSELPTLLVPSLRGDPMTWGWPGTVVFTLRETVEHGAQVLTWGTLGALIARAWLGDRRTGRPWGWTEWASSIDGGAAAALSLAAIGLQGTHDVARRLIFAAGIVLASWWISGRFFRVKGPFAPVDSTSPHG